MSPIEAKEYGIIDEIIGGESATFKIDGTTRSFPKTKKDYISWGDEEDDGSRSRRFQVRAREGRRGRGVV
jgi:ATP-dependent Clp protease, protease subunit